jgi:hypothetical protein
MFLLVTQVVAYLLVGFGFLSILMGVFSDTAGGPSYAVEFISAGVAMLVVGGGGAWWTERAMRRRP